MAKIDESIDRLGDKVDGLGVQVGTLGDKIDDLAVQVSSLTEGITRLERTIEGLAADTREQHAIARSQSEHIAQLIGVVDKLVSRN